MDAGENWVVVGDPICNVRVEKATEPQNGSSMFVMNVKTRIRRCVHRQPFSLEDDDGILLFLDDDNWRAYDYEGPLAIGSCHPNDMLAAISEKLCQLQVPRGAHQEIIESMILPRALDAERDHCCVRMAVEVDVYVVDQNAMHDYDDADGDSDHVWEVAAGDQAYNFVPASEAGIDELERGRVEDLTMCSVCLEEIAVGAEATRMPCRHIYHGGCIVEWLRKSRFCPLCRHAMPTQH